MIRLKAIILLAIAVLVAAPFYGAVAQDNTPIETYLADRLVRLSLPAGSCAYDHNQLFDAQMLASLQRNANAGDQLLLAFADCKDLEAQRHGKPVVNGYSGQILAPFILQPLSGNTSRSQLVSQVTDVNTKSGQWKEAGDTAQKLQALQNHKIALGRIVTLGVIKQDSDFVMVASGQIVPVAGLGLVPVLSIRTTTQLGVPVVVTLSHNGSSEAALGDLRATSETYARSLIALNTDEVAAAKHRKYGVVGVCLLGIAGGLFYLFTQRRKTS